MFEFLKKRKVKYCEEQKVGHESAVPTCENAECYSHANAPGLRTFKCALTDKEIKTIAGAGYVFRSSVQTPVECKKELP